MSESNSSPEWVKKEIGDLAKNKPDLHDDNAWILRNVADLDLPTKKTSQDNFVIQNALKVLGHDPGALDGMIGVNTVRAADEFKKLKGIKEAGIGSQTLKAIKIAIRNESLKEGDSLTPNPRSEIQRLEKRAPFYPDSLKRERKTAETDLVRNIDMYV